jgi:hypothetical protein
MPKQIKAKCIAVNKKPDGTAMVSLTAPAAAATKADVEVVINMQFRNAKDADEYQHMKTYTFDVK